MRETLPLALAFAMSVVYFRVLVVLVSLVSTETQTGLFGTSFRIFEMLLGPPRTHPLRRVAAALRGGRRGSRQAAERAAEHDGRVAARSRGARSRHRDPRRAGDPAHRRRGVHRRSARPAHPGAGPGPVVPRPDVAARADRRQGSAGHGAGERSRARARARTGPRLRARRRRQGSRVGRRRGGDLPGGSSSGSGSTAPGPASRRAYGRCGRSRWRLRPPRRRATRCATRPVRRDGRRDARCSPLSAVVLRAVPPDAYHALGRGRAGNGRTSERPSACHRPSRPPREHRRAAAVGAPARPLRRPRRDDGQGRPEHRRAPRPVVDGSDTPRATAPRALRHARNPRRRRRLPRRGIAGARRGDRAHGGARAVVRRPARAASAAAWLSPRSHGVGDDPLPLDPAHVPCGREP